MVLPLFFWLWDKDKAGKTAIHFTAVLITQFLAQGNIHTARPLGVALIEQGGFAFPSGHAQAQQRYG